MDLFKGFKIKCCYPFSLNIFYVRKVVYFYFFLYEYFERKNEIKYIKLNIYHQICTLQQYLTLNVRIVYNLTRYIYLFHFTEHNFVFQHLSFKALPND